MRIWSLHPKYLDPKGLVALWREALLAKAVLQGETKGYTHHPQLNRFRESDDPVGQINYYLSVIYREAEKRGYHFNKNKVDWTLNPYPMTVTKGQLAYEFRHLCRKLSIRDKERYRKYANMKNIEPHPMFSVIDGDIADWEVQKV